MGIEKTNGLISIFHWNFQSFCLTSLNVTDLFSSLLYTLLRTFKNGKLISCNRFNCLRYNWLCIRLAERETETREKSEYWSQVDAHNAFAIRIMYNYLLIRCFFVGEWEGARGTYLHLDQLFIIRKKRVSSHWKYYHPHRLTLQFNFQMKLTTAGFFYFCIIYDKNQHDCRNTMDSV